MKNYAFAVLGGLLLGGAYAAAEQPAQAHMQSSPMHRAGAMKPLNVTSGGAPKTAGKGIASKFGNGSGPIRFWAI